MFIVRCNFLLLYRDCSFVIYSKNVTTRDIFIVEAAKKSATYLRVVSSVIHMTYFSNKISGVRSVAVRSRNSYCHTIMVIGKQQIIYTHLVAASLKTPCGLRNSPPLVTDRPDRLTSLHTCCEILSYPIVIFWYVIIFYT